jgi:hypothetical protein
MAWSAVNSIALIAQLFNREHPFTTKIQSTENSKSLNDEGHESTRRTFAATPFLIPLCSSWLLLILPSYALEPLERSRTHLLFELLERRRSSAVQDSDCYQLTNYPQWAEDWRLATVPKKWPGHRPGPLGESGPNERRATELLKQAEPSARLLPQYPPPLRWFPEERYGCSSCCIRLPPAATRATVRRNPVPIV